MSDKAKEAFAKVKSDIFSLHQEVSSVKQEIQEIKSFLRTLVSKLQEKPKQRQRQEFLEKRKEKEREINKEDNEIFDKLKKISEESGNPTHKEQKTTIQHINSTQNQTPTHSSTVPQELGGSRSPNLDISIGNRGVPTDKQTNRQTDQQTRFSLKIEEKEPQILPEKLRIQVKPEIQDVGKILENLDNIKKEIRLKFKRLTKQELIVFSTIYSLEEDIGPMDYKRISSKLKLSESSIRDYINRLISKGIPIIKEKPNNKTVFLKISPELRKIASLETIIKLREL